jgi:hypothetical protein
VQVLVAPREGIARADSHTLEAATPGVPKRQRRCAPIILGLRGHSLRGCLVHREFFFRQDGKEPTKKI